MRLLLLTFILSIKGFAQDRDTISCFSKGVIASDEVSVHIKSKRDSKVIKRKFFRKKFQLVISDATYQIVSFRILWDIRRKNMLVERKNYGEFVTPEFENVEVENEKLYSLKNLEPGALLSFDCIIIKKGDTYYKVSPFVINISL